MIEQQTNSKSRYISITNYDLYQVSEQQVNNTRTTNEQQVNTNNNVNNDNNVNNIYSSAQELVLVQDAEAPSPVGLMPTNVKDKGFPIYKYDIELWIQTYPAVDVIQELKKIYSWLDANPTKRKTSNGMKRFINAWLSKAQDNPRLSAQPQRQSLKDFVFDDNFTF